ncbi:transmembrane transporter [Aureococcus anophagefferens]|nr:transmembrane transporter [Aureococcus anophagefferens]
MDSSPAQHVVSPINFDTVQPARERRPSYRQSYEDWRSGEGSSSVKGEVHGIRVATYISGALATPHGSSAQFRRVSSVNLLAKSLEHANELYDESVMNAAEATALPGHGSFAWSVAVSALPVGGPFGSWVGGCAADGRLGRDGALWSIGALYGLGGIALCWGLELQRIDVVIGARLLLGVACGATTVVVPVYLGELAPPRLRGAFGTLTQLAMVVGILAADVVALGAGAGVLFAASALVALAMLLLAGALPLAATPKSVLAVGAR